MYFLTGYHEDHNCGEESYAVRGEVPNFWQEIYLRCSAIKRKVKLVLTMSYFLTFSLIASCITLLCLLNSVREDKC